MLAALSKRRPAMGKTAKPRKAHRPRPVSAMPLLLAKAGAERMTRPEIDSYVVPVRELIGRIKRGADELHEWSRLRDAAMLSECLLMTGAARVAAHDVEAISTPWFEAIETAVARRRAGPRDGLMASERERLDALLAWYEALLGEATRRQLDQAQQRALNRLRYALAVIDKEERRLGLGAAAAESAGVMQRGQAC